MSFQVVAITKGKIANFEASPLVPLSFREGRSGGRIKISI